ncbi:802_t:CDS:2 [Paraglomus occultum]|uniref:802_t:CDS:1 n=1 Tax=Paraglomus occultum TaxID=144539 RepID=A0A9N8WMR9_9GLOM|nr:802_t:CDS:2 [Paraglomus occultum]
MVVMISRTLSEKELHSKLKKIFTKIGCLDKAQEGIRDLYDLLLEHPECDSKVNAFLEHTGIFFRRYIRSALAEITTVEMKKCGLLPSTPAPIKREVRTVPFDDLSSPAESQSDSDITLTGSSAPSTPGTPGSPAVTELPHIGGWYILVRDIILKIEIIGYRQNILMGLCITSTIGFKDKFAKETFEQTRSRLHSIFQYEKYKNGQRRSSLPNMSQNDAERLAYVKDIINSSSHIRRSSWNHTPSPLIPTERFGSIPSRKFKHINLE